VTSPGAILDRSAADIDELSQARQVKDLDTVAGLPDPQMIGGYRG
jgi:hypothetical protein